MFLYSIRTRCSKTFNPFKLSWANLKKSNSVYLTFVKPWSDCGVIVINNEIDEWRLRLPACVQAKWEGAL